MRYIISLFLVVFVVACNRMPSDDEIRGNFLMENPNCNVIAVYVGEGDGVAAYYYIKYNRQHDPKIYTDVWQYIDDGKGSWKINARERQIDY